MWQHKAERLIAEHAMAAYKAANILPNGQKRKRHVPYRLPEIAEALVAALGANDEHEAKRLFMVESAGSWSLI